MKYLLFTISGQRFAFALDAVVEVMALGKISLVPKTPPYVSGLFDWHNQPVLVFDLSKKFELKEPASKYIIIVSHNKDVFGFLVDVIEDIWEALPKMAQKPTKAIAPKIKGFVEKVLLKDEKVILSLDVSKVTAL